MTAPKHHHSYRSRVALLATLLTFGLGASAAAAGGRPTNPPRVSIPDSLRGLSHRLRARVLPPDPEFTTADTATAATLFHMVLDSASGRSFHFIPLIPFEAKRGTRVGSYSVGRWPAERRGSPLSDAYRVPAGFVLVTEDNRDTPLSDHFALRDFLADDQRDVWPKPLVIDTRLVDKLELVLAELRRDGHRAPGLVILSGFRTPRVNARGARSAQSTESRHQYGDAADVILDADGDRRMDDLNRDGRINIEDARTLLRYIDRVEARYPSLEGGAGLYRGSAAQGPFVHIDARGKRARWSAP
jgi:hypothetical protein